MDTVFKCELSKKLRIINLTKKMTAKRFSVLIIGINEMKKLPKQVRRNINHKSLIVNHE